MAESKLPAKSDRKSHRRPPGDARRGFKFSPTGQITCHKIGQGHVLVTCKRASLSGAMYHGFEGAISTFWVYFPYLNLTLRWSKEPGPPQFFSE